ncbi:MAG: DUF4445 domain-containing protein [Acidobacteria bacterium]|nr:DUF4445 domain-containing protein [Acidobacteriota bacterium]
MGLQPIGVDLYTIDFEPVGRRRKCPKGISLLDCARRLNVDIVSICGGMGKCKRCKVQIVSGLVSPPTPADREAFTKEELKQNYRLACMAYPQSDVKILVPPESLSAPQRTQVEGLDLHVEPEPPVCGLEAQMTPPSLDAPDSDDQNLWSALKKKYDISPGRMDITVQRDLSTQLRNQNWKASVALRDSEIVALGASHTRWLGMAVDIGTTKIAAYLVDMESGETLAARGLMNPQISYGEDLVSRIYFASKSAENAEKLQMLLVDALNQTADSLCREAGADPSRIVESVVVANTAIHHLFLRLPVHQLGVSPYVPAVRSALDIKARDIGLHIAPGAYVHMLPNVAAYVGADHVAMILATGMDRTDGVRLGIDIGTNTEICLNRRGKMTSVSCASGPAFEGAHIQHGMRAASGAIEHVRLSGDHVEIQTIGGKPSVGICGSGLLDVIAQMLENKVIDATGRMNAHPLVRRRDGQKEFVLVDRPEDGSITVSQKDVRELQLAKAAIRLGIETLLEDAGVREKDIDGVVIAGAFGTFIDVESAVTIGMLPPLPLERFKQVGNAAGAGARLALISKSRRRAAQRIASRDGYIELASVPDFNIKFARASSMTWAIKE